MNNRENGVTLMVLVITIIVLLIIVSVGITLSVGDDGILNRAVQGRETTETGILVERLENMMMKYQTSEYAYQPNGLNAYLDKRKNEKMIDNYSINGTDGTVILEKDGKSFRWIRIGTDITDYKIEVVE